MRDRLIELIDDFIHTEDVKWWYSAELDEQLADYLLENGVIVPPVKVGDTVYYLASNLHTKVAKIRTGTVTRIAITEDGIDLFADNWAAKLPYGKRSFLTKEEAEKAIELLQKKQQLLQSVGSSDRLENGRM